MSRKGIETLVGLFVLLGLLAMAFLALQAANLASVTRTDTYTVTARFDNIGGLKVRSPVRSAGVTVGRVRAITLDRKSFQGVVTMEIERRYSFPKDSSAAILTAGLLGDQYVGINPGGDDNDLADNDTIKITQSAVVLESLISRFLFSKAAEGGTDAKK